jgi:hypothetical protein
MGELGALFNPGMRHELEERRSKAMRREEEGNARDGDLRIDLESGVAVIAVDRDEDEPASATADQPTSAAEDQPAFATEDESTSATADESSSATAGDSAGSVQPADAGSLAGENPLPADPGSAAGENPLPVDAGSAPSSEAPAELRPRGKRGLAASRS